MNATTANESTPGALAERHDEIPDGLSDELVRTLAALGGADQRAAQALIASLPYGSRAGLSAYRLIEPIVRYPDAISPITVTPAGWCVIVACAEAYSPNEEQERALTAERKAAEATYRATRSEGTPTAAALARAKRLADRFRSGPAARL
jgi:hypothetical protein